MAGQLVEKSCVDNIYEHIVLNNFVANIVSLNEKKENNNNEKFSVKSVNNTNKEIRLSGSVNLNQSYINSLNSSSFIKLTKKKRFNVIFSILRKLKNQILVYNIKKLFELYLVYHRRERMIQAIVDLFVKTREYNVDVLRVEILRRNKEKYKNHRKFQHNCRDVGTFFPTFMRLIDSSRVLEGALKITDFTLVELKDKLPILMYLTPENIIKVIDLCKRSGPVCNFPLQLLPEAIQKDFATILNIPWPHEVKNTLNVARKNII